MMIMKELKWLKTMLVTGVFLFSAGCSDENVSSGVGEVDFEITDAPSDDADIKSVVVTVAELRVDGKKVEGFTKQTIDLKAYSEGNTRLLGSTTLASKSYDNVTLVLDLDRDADGNEPGCYVQTLDNTKYKLKSTATGTAEIAISNSWNVLKDVENRVVIDFDIRKAIRHDSDGSIRYGFVSDASLQSAVRIVAWRNAGMIKGSYENQSNVEAEKIVVYAYKKGSFNSATEMQAQGEDQVYFKNAITSAEVRSSLTGNSYLLAFLEPGDYELHFVAYEKSETSGRYNVAARLRSETSVNGAVGDVVSVKAGTTVNLSSSIKGIF